MKNAIILICLLLLLIGCRSITGDVVKEEQIVIGVSSPETGFGARFGEYVRNGMELALERLPEEERNNIKIVYEDDQCNSVEGFNIARKLVAFDNAKFVIGPFCAAVVIPTTDFYEENKVIRLVTGLGNEGLRDIGNHTFVFLGDTKSLMTALAEHAYEKGDRKVSVLYLQDDYGQENINHFKRIFQELGGAVIAEESFNPKSVMDYRTQLKKLQSKNPDSIFLIAIGGSLVSSLQQIDELGIETNIYGIRNTEDPEIIKSAGKLIEGVSFPSITVEPITNEGKWYLEQYLVKYGEPHEVVSANAYDSFNVLYNAIKECNQNVECVKLKINKIKDYEGVSGTFSIDSDGFAIRQPVIKTVKNGEFVIVS